MPQMYQRRQQQLTGLFWTVFWGFFALRIFNHPDPSIVTGETLPKVRAGGNGAARPL